MTMPTSGAFENNFQTGYKLRVEWSIASQSIANNTSELKVTAFLVSTGSSYTITSSYSKPMKMYIDGTLYEDKIANATLKGNEKRQIMTRTVTIKHNTDGSRSVALRFSLYLEATLSGTKFRWVHAPEGTDASETAVLATIPRASKPTLSASTVELGKSLTISTNRASDRFTHRLSYGWYGTEFVRISWGVADSYTWTVPLTFANNIPDATKGWGTIRLETYDGDTRLGQAEVTFTATVPASMKPTCSIQVLDSTTTKDTYGNLVKGLSRLHVKTTATKSYNSDIVAYNVTANGQKYTSNEFTTGVLAAAGTTTVSATVTDKRGRTSTAATASFTVLDYSAPKITALKVHRCDANGNEVSTGGYVRVNFSAVVSALNNKNTAAYTLKYKKSTDSGYTTVSLTDLDNTYTVTDQYHIFEADVDASYDIIVTVTDNHGSGSRETSASTAFTLMNWSAGGTSMGIGKVAEESGTLEVALKNHFYGRTQQEGNRYATASQGTYETAGFVRAVRVQITSTHANSPMTFVFSRRQAPTTMTVYLQLSGPTAVGGATSLASIRYEGTNYDAYAHSPDKSTWDIYVKKGNEYDTITLQDWYTSQQMDVRVKVTFPGDQVSTVPQPFYKATPAALDNILDYVYPVGSIYLAYSHHNPATLFGGTWERLKDAFLWSVGTDTAVIGKTGGSSTHTLTVNELPAHSHGSVYSQHAEGTKGQAWYTTAGTSLAYGAVSTGGGAAHNNMPPYIQISAWRRTA